LSEYMQAGGPGGSSTRANDGTLNTSVERPWPTAPYTHTARDRRDSGPGADSLPAAVDGTPVRAGLEKKKGATVDGTLPCVEAVCEGLGPSVPRERIGRAEIIHVHVHATIPRLVCHPADAQRRRGSGPGFGTRDGGLG